MPTLINPILPNPIVAVATLPQIAFMEAKWYRRLVRRHAPIWIVIHCTAGAEGKGKAVDGAYELQRIPPHDQGGRPRSAHLLIDTSAVVQCVPFEREAYHAGQTANIYGEGIELCGSDQQTRAEWLDDLSLPMLALAAHVLRWRCDELGIPLHYVAANDLRLRAPGVTTHAEITKAFPRDTTHTDPGPNFPLAELIDAAQHSPATR
jgi:N-acetylmuramoyl-L-alanine amidase-like protein